MSKEDTTVLKESSQLINDQEFNVNITDNLLCLLRECLIQTKHDFIQSDALNYVYTISEFPKEFDQPDVPKKITNYSGSF